MEVHSLKTTIKEKERRRRIEIFIRLNKDKARLNSAAQLIQDHIYTRKIKLRNEGKELRQKLKDLPFVCRSSFVKMHLLKAQTARLTTNMNIKLRR